MGCRPYESHAFNSGLYVSSNRTIWEWFAAATQTPGLLWMHAMWSSVLSSTFRWRIYRVTTTSRAHHFRDCSERTLRMRRRDKTDSHVIRLVVLHRNHQAGNTPLFWTITYDAKDPRVVGWRNGMLVGACFFKMPGSVSQVQRRKTMVLALRRGAKWQQHVEEIENHNQKPPHVLSAWIKRKGKPYIKKDTLRDKTMIGRTVYVKRKSTETYEQNRVIDIRIPAVVEKQLSSADWDVIPERCSVGIDLALLHLSKTQIPRRTIYGVHLRFLDGSRGFHWQNSLLFRRIRGFWGCFMH